MPYTILTEKNFILYCAKHYRNPHCQSFEEFCEDIRRFKYIRKLITRFVTKGKLKERLILNHLITLSNVFEIEALSRMLFLKMEDQMEQLRPFLEYLGIMPKYILNVKVERVIQTENIPLDLKVVEALRKI